jgi:flagellar biosynthesis chaperone FliJ
MQRPIIRRLARIDDSSQALLVKIVQNGAQPLDLKLVATDQEHLYHGALRDNALKSLQTSNYSGDLNEWKDILSYTLLQTQPENSQELFTGLEAVAAIAKSIVTITIRKKIGSITQRLGEIKLNEDDEREEVAAFEWVDTAVATSDDLRSQLENLQKSVAQQQDTVTKVTAQLDELVQAKKSHEEELLSKFAALLNAKKLKIRDQQHLLSRAKVDPDVALEVQRARDSSSPQSRQRPRRQPGESGIKKRKAKEEVVPGSDEEMDDAAAEQDIADDNETDEERQIETPEDSDATEDEDGVDASTASQSAPLNKDGNTLRRTQDESEVQKSIEQPPPPPPRRGLPFRRKSAQESSARGDGGGDDDDDETDDEL